MRFLFQSCALAVLLGQAVLAQDRPDFSGEWVLFEPSIDPPSVICVVQNDETIRIEHTVYARTLGRRTGPSSGTYRTVDGGVAAVPGDRSGVQWSWKDGTLVVTFEGGKFIPGAVYQEVWSLDPSGRLIVRTKMRGPNAAPTTTRIVYRRRR